MGTIGGWLAALSGSALLLTGWSCAPASAKDSIYWANSGNIQVGDLNGGGSIFTLYSGENFPIGVVVDPATGKVYWANTNGTIRIGDLRGSKPAQTLFSGEATPQGIAIDPSAGKLYWTDLSSGTIRVGNLNGSGVARTLFAGESQPEGLAIDPAGKRVYWADNGSGLIRAGDLDGTGTAQTLFSGEEFAFAVAISRGARKLYWTRTSEGSSEGGIRVGPLNGSGPATDLFTGEGYTTGLALDPTAGKAYWLDNGHGWTRVGNLNGGGTPRTLFSQGPFFLALLRAPASVSRPGVSGGRRAGSVLSCSTGVWAADLVGSFLYRAPAGFAYRWTRNGTMIMGANTSSLRATAAGDYTCAVTATNNAGSASASSRTHPVVPIARISGVHLSRAKRSARFTFTAGAGISGFQCALIMKRAHHQAPKVSFSRCTSPKRYSHLKPGRYVFEVRGLSAAGPGPAATRSFALR